MIISASPRGYYKLLTHVISKRTSRNLFLAFAVQVWSIFFLTEAFAVTNVTVNCNQGEKVQDALQASLLDDPINVRILGQCDEDIRIRRNNVTLRGRTAGSIASIINGSVLVESAVNILIRDLRINAVSQNFGIAVRHGSQVEARNVIVKGNVPNVVSVSYKSSLTAFTVRFIGGAETDSALSASHRSGIRLTDAVLLTEKVAKLNGAALSLNFNSAAKIIGNSIIRHASAPAADGYSTLAALVSNNSFLDTRAGIREQSIVLRGNTAVANGSKVRLEKLRAAGTIRARGLAQIELLASSRVTNGVTLEARSKLGAAEGAFVVGTVKCTGESGVSGSVDQLSLDPNCELL